MTEPRAGRPFARERHGVELRGAIRRRADPNAPRIRVADEGAMWLGWLVRLRAVAVVAQVVTLSVTYPLLDQPRVTLPMLLGLAACLVVANILAKRSLGGREPVHEGHLLAQLLLDVTVLTGFFVLSGGPANTFTVLYLIHIAMGAVMLSPPRAGVLTGAVVAAYALLHAVHLPLHLDRHRIPPDQLVRIGQLLAFCITAAASAVFVLGLATSLRQRKQQLLEARDRTARTDRLRSVGTLAAGAAHELNTPLSTIGLRLRRLQRRHDDEDSARDIEVIRAQLDRCKQVVDQLLVGAGDPSAADIERRSLSELVREGVSMWSKGSSLPAKLDDRSEGAVVTVPRIAFVQALINLLENAREAQEEVANSEPLQLALLVEDDECVVQIADRGCGLPDDADQVGEPFFTTKPTGTGLGVFVARSVADGAGGGLRYSAASNGGTVARWWFPNARRRSA